MGTGPRIAAVTAALLATIALAAASAHAFPPGGGSEISTGTAPANGSEETSTDTLPSTLTQGSIAVQPLAGDDLEAFNQMIDAVANSFPGTKLSRKGQATLGCVLMSYLFIANQPSDHVYTFDDVNLHAALLAVCLSLASSLHTPTQAQAGAAAPTCGRIDAAVTVHIAHSRKGYSVTIVGPHARIARPALNVSCRRSGRGLVIGVRPRIRGQTLRRAGATTLGIGYSNLSTKPVRTRTIFTAH